MNSNLPTLLFASGAWHGPESWSLVLPLIQTRGYRCLVPHPVTNIDNGQPKTVKAGIVQFSEVISAETSSGRDVVVVNHSYGGFLGNSALRGYTRKNATNIASADSGHVIGSVNITAFLPQTDRSLHDLYAIQADFSITSRQFDEADARGYTQIINGTPSYWLYTDMSEKDGEYWTSRLVPQSAVSFATSAGVYAGHLDVPIWYLVCTGDQALDRVGVQVKMVDTAIRNGADITVRQIDAAHAPMLSRSRETAEFILEAVDTLRARAARVV